MTCIDLGILQTQNLTPFNKILIQSPSAPGPVFSYLYKVDLTVIHPSGNSQMNLVIPALTVGAPAISHLGTDALVGCDVLSRCRFIYDGSGGQFSLIY